MRSTSTSFRGWFALIRKGSGAVFGIARLVGSGTSLSQDQMLANCDKHQIPPDMIKSGSVANWNTPWELAEIRKLPRPVPYMHRPGAVTWVSLDDEVSEAIALQLGEVPEISIKDAPNGRAAARSVIMPDQASAHQKGASKSSLAVLERTPAPHGAEGDMVGEVAITEGNIKNNHIYLRSFFTKFPNDAIGGSNKIAAAKREITVDWGGPEPAITDLDGQKMFFRKRAWIGAFFRLNRAEAGDKVQVLKSGHYRYRVVLRKTSY